MARLILSIMTSVLVMFLTGCAKPCFYQAGKNIEQCERDLLQCIQKASNCSYISKNALLSSTAAEIQQEHQPAELTCLYMQARGYRYLDANKLPQNLKQIMVVAPFQKYWAVDGAGAASEERKVTSEQQLQEKSHDYHVRSRIRYQVRKDASDQLMKDESGNYIFVPVSNNQEKETVSLRQVGEK